MFKKFKKKDFAPDTAFCPLRVTQQTPGLQVWAQSCSNAQEFFWSWSSLSVCVETFRSQSELGLFVPSPVKRGLLGGSANGSSFLQLQSNRPFVIEKPGLSEQSRCSYFCSWQTHFLFYKKSSSYSSFLLCILVNYSMSRHEKGLLTKPV